MAKSDMLRGAMTALITPFRDDAVDEDALRALVDRQITDGIDGLVPCGTTGEAATMSEAERLEVIRVVAEQANGRVPVIAGTGTNDTRKTVAFTQRACEIKGVDAVLVVAPYYNKPGPRMLRAHFEHVADESPLPVVLYNVPGRTVVSLTAGVVAELAAHENVIGIKEATGDLKFAAELHEAVGAQDFAYFSGDDFTTMPFVAMGGHGCISVVSDTLTDAMSALAERSRGGDLEEAQRLNVRLQALARALFARSNPVPTKAIASALGWCSSEVRAPLYEAEPEFIVELQQVFSTYNDLM